MIIVLLGASGSGKSTVEKYLSDHYGYEKIVSCTTRQPRNGEVNGRDYHFIDNETFDEMLKRDLFAEYDEYSQSRFYGTMKKDYESNKKKSVYNMHKKDDKNTHNTSEKMFKNVQNAQMYGNKIVVLTPNGLRQLKKNCPDEKIFTVLVEANLGTRVKRYIDRCGVDKFTFDDKNEIAARVERDFGMFCGLEREVDMVVDNSEGSDIRDIADEIITTIYRRRLS